MSLTNEEKAKIFQAFIALSEGDLLKSGREIANEHMIRIAEGIYTKPEPFQGLIIGPESKQEKP